MSSFGTTLIIHDNPLQLKALETMLGEAGFATLTAADIESALETTQLFAADLIITNAAMPDMTPAEFCRKIRSNLTTADVAVLILTATSDNEAGVIESLEAGADDFIDAAAPAELVRRKVERLITQRYERRAREEADDALRRSEERYRAFIEQSSEGIWCFETTQPIPTLLPVDEQIRQMYANGHLIECNAVMAKMYGFPGPEEFIGMRLEILLPPQDPQNIEYLETFIDSGYRLSDSESKEVDARGNVKYFLNNLVGIVEDGHLVRAWGSQRDITGRKQAEEALRESEERFSKAFHSSPVAMGISRFADGRYLDVNESFLRLGGYTRDEVIGRTGAELRHWPEPQQREKVMRLLSEQRFIRNEELQIRRKSGEVLDVIASADVVTLGEEPCILAIAQDVTAHKRLEEQLRQSQKVEAVGRLAGGVAHDFNNLLTAILGYSELLLQEVGPDSPLRMGIEEIRKAGGRAAGLTKQLLAFSRKQVLQPKVLNLNAVVADLEKMLGRLIGEDVELTTILSPDLGQVKADPGQVEQVIVNLAVNARDAMPAGGKITIETRNIYFDDEYARSRVDAQPGAYVMLAVSDTGTGMDAATQSRIFEPFFTTKGPGKGTGLGRSTVYGIVKQSGGHVWVYSEPGHGTTFKIYLARQDADADAAYQQGEAGAIPGGSGTILLVEDEEMVRHLARRVLQGAGYTVIEAANGQDALRIGDCRDAPIHLLLTDVVMPRLGGRELVRQLSQKHPNMKVVYMSGYSDEAVISHGILDPGTAFIQKPFAPAALAHKVREVLQG